MLITEGVNKGRIFISISEKSDLSTLKTESCFNANFVVTGSTT